MIESIVIWGVIWFFVMLSAVPALGFVGAVIGNKVNRHDGFAVGGVVGWVLGIVLSIFSVIQVILHIIHLVQEVSV